MQNVIGVDLGGSAIKMGVFIKDGTCLKSISLATPQPARPKSVVNAIAEGINQLQQDYTCQAIGLGVPGPTDNTKRIARKSINLPGWDDVPVADWLEAKTGLPTMLENDANCAAIGEAWLGAGRKFKNFILLTLGTGVGGGIFIDGKLFTGSYGAAGELGLITLDTDGFPCRSGNQGSLEQYASIGAVLRETGKEPAQMGKLAQSGDGNAIEFWQNYGRVLGAGLASLVYVLTPEAIIIGGGISASSQFFLPSTMQELEKRVVSPSRTGLQLLTAELGNKAGMLGAAKLVWDRNNMT
ncbi:ROK family protein [Waterburya agarophytonicola K14]|uniref:ROK family protein n=1 Tax=Waterburya agarophytonicola KI4 TaxID=2874699 RepID=A0A964FLJ2_9CYAN|nr:ROK family protein [Waterburya agarophytonicola]MCC0179413.1 ROK family protein [Waterburya agarophytonicola KI4]